MASAKKVVKSKGMAVMVYVDGKILITIQVNLCRLILTSPQNSPELLSSTYTNTAIAWL